MCTRPNSACSLLLLSLSLLVGACGPKQVEEPAPQPLVVFPLPPDTARIQFLTRISDSRDVARERSRSVWQSLVGESEAEEIKPIIKPYGIAIWRGRIYICDTILGGLEIIDLAAGSFEYFQPRGLGQLRKPINCAVDRVDGRLYVADIERRQVVVFDSLGNYLTGFGDHEGGRPVDVFVGATDVWVADIESRSVLAYAKADYRLKTRLSSAAEGDPGYLYQPTNIWVTDDRVYVSDFGDFKIKVYTRDGVFLNSVGGYGRALGQFTRSKGIAVDRASILYVVDAGFQNVQMFDRDGELLMFFGGGYQGPGTMWLPAKVIVDYDNLEYFEDRVHESFELKYLILVTNQYGPDKINVYGFVEPKGEGASD